MSTHIPPNSELQLFQQYINERRSGTDGSLENAVAEFREYQRQLGDIRAKLKVAEQQSAAGQTGPFDAEAVKQRLRGRLAREGVVD